MTTQSIIDNLYRELLFGALFLLIILLYNSLVVYKRKLSDSLSLMLIAVTSMCAFEILWEYCDGHKSLYVFSYIGGCGYTIAFLFFAISLSRFFFEQLDMSPNSKLLLALFYKGPFVIFGLVCVTTPWTHLLFWVDENGILQEMVLFGTLFYVLLLLYLSVALLSALLYMIFGRRKNPAAVHTAKSLLTFGVLAPAIYLLQILIMGTPDSDYFALSLACAIALVYLTTTVSTHALLETQAQVKAVETDLRIAAKIQSDALPPVAPEFAEYLDLSLRASMNTAREVGGDFYDYFEIDSHRICLLIADVSGKGTPAALFMMTVKTMLKDYALTHESTAEIFTAVNRRLCENNGEGMFATAWIGILDTDTKILQYTNAGHNYPLFHRSGEDCTVLKTVHGVFLAGFDDTEYGQSELQLRAGDRLLLYTDGVTEAHSKGKALYGLDRLTDEFKATEGKSGDEVLESISRDVNEFAAGEPQFDDITMMVLAIK